MLSKPKLRGQRANVERVVGIRTKTSITLVNLKLRTIREADKVISIVGIRRQTLIQEIISEEERPLRDVRSYHHRVIKVVHTVEKEIKNWRLCHKNLRGLADQKELSEP